jgi:S-adenosylmethionine uptake transporter
VPPGLHRHHSILPFLVAASGIALFSVMDAVMKSASLQVGAYNAMLFRSGFGVLLMLPLWRATGGRWPGQPALRLHALRGLISAGLATSFFWGLIRLPLAEAIALSFIAPLIALYLAAVMLGEKIARGAVIASLLGFAGVLVIGAGRLGREALSEDAMWGIGAVLLSAVLYAFNLIFQRKQAQLASPQEVALFQMGFAGLFLALAAPWLAVVPGLPALGEIATGAALAAVSLMLLSWAYARAEAQVLLPIEYTAFIWAALLGWLVFAEPVTVETMAGVVLIVIGCWIAARKSAPAHTEQTTL